MVASPGNKRVYFDIMRVIACAQVIFNHREGYLLFMTTTGWKQFLYMSLTMITRLCVPLFFMISGALLLPKEEDFYHVFRKRFLRMLAVLLFFSTLLFVTYRIAVMLSETEYVFTTKDFLLGFLENTIPGTTPYWYMYAYLGMLFVLPFMQRIAKELTKTEVLALIVLHFFVVSLLPMINLFFNVKGIDISIRFSNDFSVPFAVTGAFFYPLIGYYLEYNVDMQKLKASRIWMLVLSAIAGIVLSNICTYYEAGITGCYTQNYVMMFEYVSAITAFIVIKYLYTVKLQHVDTHRFDRFICFMGTLTLGIYLLDPLFNTYVFGSFYTLASPVLPTIVLSFTWVLVSMTLGAITTCLLKKLPLVKMIL